MYRVLLVDDEPIVLETLSSIIPWDTIGCELIGTSRNGMDAYNKICDDYPDIVITDIKMPVLNGLELIEKAKKLDANIDFIILSGYDDFAFAQTAMKFGVKYYNLKPVRKEDLIAVLEKMVSELKLKEQARRSHERQLIDSLKLPLVKSFLFDACNSLSLTEKTIKNYIHLLGFPEDGISCCICTYLEPAFLTLFQAEFCSLQNKHAIPVLWPAFYVTNSFVFLYTASCLKIQEILREFVGSRQYPKQQTALECQFLTFDNSTSAFREIIRKLSRYHTIWIINEMQKPESVSGDNLYTSENKARELKNFSSEYEITQFLNSAFDSSMNVESAVLLCIQLLFSSEFFANKDFDYITLQYLFRSSSVTEVRSIAASLLLRQLPAANEKGCSQKATLIPRVKEYVNSHLASETLSLKWLAENQFFISVGYLSKQFQLEEGVHFSYYLNYQRIELAKKMMGVYHNNNIQDIAQQVGFRNNPRYFSQVFKKFTGMTPSEYLNSLI